MEVPRRGRPEAVGDRTLVQLHVPQTHPILKVAAGYAARE